MAKTANDISEYIFNEEQPALYSGSNKHEYDFDTRKVIHELDTIDDDPLYIRRFIIALLSSSSYFESLTADDIDKIRTIYPEFRTLVGSTEKNLDAVFIFDEWRDIQEEFNNISKSGLPEQEVIDYLQHEKHKSNGRYNFIHNAYLNLYLLPQLEKAYNGGDCEKFDAIFREYFATCLQDYHTNIARYHYRDRFSGARYRTTLKKSAFNRLMALFDGTGNWETDIEYVASKLVKAEKLYSSEQDFTLLYDKDFKNLMSFTLNIERSRHLRDSKYIDNFSKIIRMLHINIWGEHVKFLTSYRDSAFDDAQTLIDELNGAIKEYPMLQPSFIQFIVNYLTTNYHCCLGNYDTVTTEVFSSNSHLQLLNMLCEQFGADYIWDCYYNDNPNKPLNDIFHGLLAKVSTQPELIERKALFDQALLRNAIPNITTKEQDNEPLLHFILTGENPDAVAKMVLDNSNIEYLSWLSQPYFERLATVYFNGKNDKLTVNFFENAANKYSATPLRALSEVSLKHPHCVISYMKGFIGHTLNINYEADTTVSWYNGVYYPDLYPRSELAYLQQHNIPCVQYINASSASVKAPLLICLKGTVSNHDQALLLIDMLKEKPKGLSANLQACIKALPDTLKQAVHSTIAEQLVNFSGQKEINAVACLCQEPMNEETALELLDKVNTPQSRALLIKHGNINFIHLYKTADGNFDLAGYLTESYQTPDILPVSEDILQLLETKDGSNGYEAAIRLLLVYQHHDTFEPSSEGQAILSQVTETSLDNFMCHLINQYADTLTAKNRWLLNIPTLHATPNTVKLLIPFFARWANNAKHQLAAQLIKQMAGSGLIQAFIALDRLSRNTKKQSIKEAIEEAFAIGASQKGLTKDEMGDCLVDNIGFIDGAIPLPYCDQEFALILNKELKFSIRRPDGKIVKSLPKPKVNDDAQAAAEVNKHFKELKKILKDMVTLQTHRLEDAFVIWRQWQFEKWATLFLANPVMNKLASKLVWGIYENNTLIQTFTVNPTVITIDDEALDIAPHCQIGLVHPIELSTELLEEWQNYFADWEISVLFDQLTRPVLTLTSTESDPLAYVPNLIFDQLPLTVVDRLRKKGWREGNIGGGGGFDELYKELRDSNLSIKITFDKEVWYGGYGYTVNEDNITISQIEFYHSWQQRNDIKQLPQRLVQELVREAINGFK